MERNLTQDRNKAKTLLTQLAALKQLDDAALREQWRLLMGTEPPNYRSSVIVRRLAYRIQELVWGTSQSDIKRRLNERKAALEMNQSAVREERALARRKERPVVGTRFVREFNQERHEVTVTADGYDYRGRSYKSLTAVAKAITGTQWNGRAFFGLYRDKRIKGGKK